MYSNEKKALIEEFFINLFKTQANLNRISQKLMAQEGISFPCWRIMCFIKIHGETPVTIPFIADTLMMSRQAIQRQIQFLIQSKYIIACDNPQNKRSAYYRFTDEGVAIYQHTIQNVFDPWVEDHLADIDDSLLKNTLEVFHRLTKL